MSSFSFSAYHRLCSKYGQRAIDSTTYRKSYDIKEETDYPCIDMNTILSKEFVDLLPIYHPGAEEQGTLIIEVLARLFYNGGIPAVEEYILSLI